jgi:hypothetical protein
VGRRGSVEYQNPWAAQTTRRHDADVAAAAMGPVTWRGLTWPPSQPQQIGLWGEAILSQVEGYYNQPQLHSAVEFLQKGWYVPTVSAVPTFDQTQQPHPIGGQRWGSVYSGPIGPLNVKAMQARVAAAQVRQSGLMAQTWAMGLGSGAPE